MINFQRPAFSDLTNFSNKHLYQSYCLSSELYIATVLETHEQANKTT